jgi:hypothetical protein
MVLGQSAAPNSPSSSDVKDAGFSLKADTPLLNKKKMRSFGIQQSCHLK